MAVLCRWRRCEWVFGQFMYGICFRPMHGIWRGRLMYGIWRSGIMHGIWFQGGRGRNWQRWYCDLVHGIWIQGGRGRSWHCYALWSDTASPWPSAQCGQQSELERIPWPSVIWHLPAGWHESCEWEQFGFCYQL